MQKALNNMMQGPAPGMPNPMMMTGGQPGQPMMQMTPQQQMEFMAMMEQQTRMLAQFTGMMPGTNAGFPPQQQNPQGRSLFDRVEPGRGRGGTRGRGRGGASQNGHVKTTPKPADGDTAMEGDAPATTEASSMDVEQTEGQQKQHQDPFSTMCRFNVRCTNKDCPFVHQSPVAPPGTVVDMNDTCSFGASCKNPKCSARHPSPATAQVQELCKFYPNCTKSNCPFKHPTMPVCRFGANCTNANCPYTHHQIPCRFNPCTNIRCPYKHEAGQKRATTIEDFTWTPEKAAAQAEAAKNQPQPQEGDNQHHVSSRKFVDETDEEELIKPDVSNGTNGGTNGTAVAREEVIT
jgi:hypothetical protein